MSSLSTFQLFSWIFISSIQLESTQIFTNHQQDRWRIFRLLASVLLDLTRSSAVQSLRYSFVTLNCTLFISALGQRWRPPVQAGRDHGQDQRRLRHHRGQPRGEGGRARVHQASLRSSLHASRERQGPERHFVSSNPRSFSPFLLLFSPFFDVTQATSICQNYKFGSTFEFGISQVYT